MSAYNVALNLKGEGIQTVRLTGTHPKIFIRKGEGVDTKTIYILCLVWKPML